VCSLSYVMSSCHLSNRTQASKIMTYIVNRNFVFVRTLVRLARVHYNI